MNIYKSILFVLLIISLKSIAYSQEENKNKKSFDYSKSTLFNKENELKFDIIVNRKELLKDIGQNRKYHKALLIYKNENGDSIRISAKLRTRGNFRRNRENCSFPPLTVNFPKKISKNDEIFKGQNKLKLVVPCKNFDKFQEYVIIEYLIYKLYNIITEKSFKVRLAEINLIDSLENKKDYKFKGFFVEENNQMADRNKGKIKNVETFNQEQTIREEMTMFVCFQYLIGNTDWSFYKLHNVKLLYINDNNKPFPVPFDFDWSGLINAPYAVPAPLLGTQTVKERVFRGFYRTYSEYVPVIKFFNEKRTEINKLFEQSIDLNNKTKERIIEYIDEFYNIINDKSKLENIFIENCRN
ncbi:MAG: hypothetical protein JXR51_02210 [Bacteroidales bacterium]|nr:hypothetical protein [Bacteroidales bacterium]MBN2755961.1 hypothetical protein [Bacteroidales bacterium]